MPRRNRGARLKWVEKRQVYYIVWFERGRERLRSTGTADGRQAEAVLATFIRQYQRPVSGPRPADEVSCATALDYYGEHKGSFAKDPVRIGQAIAAMLPFFGKRMVSEVNDRLCADYLEWRKRAPGTTRRELGTLTAALNYCEGRILDRAAVVTLPAKPPGKDRWLTRSEASQLLNAARTARSDVRLYLPLFIVLGLYTGARKEALLSLRWPQVNLKTARINFGRDSGEETSKKRAHIPIPARLMTFLRLAHKRRNSDLGFIIHDKGEQVIDIGGAWHGDSDPKSYVQGSFGRACKRAGLVGVSPHTLRHTCGTWLAQAGVPLREIGGWLGHTDARTTELYAHHHPDYHGGAKRALDRGGR